MQTQKFEKPMLIFWCANQCTLMYTYVVVLCMDDGHRHRRLGREATTKKKPQFTCVLVTQTTGPRAPAPKTMFKMLGIQSALQGP